MVKKFLKFIKEDLSTSLSISNIIDELNKRKNKVAQMLFELRTNPRYDSDSDINFLSLDKEINMIRFLPKNKRTDNWEENISNKLSVPVRIGRIINKIYNSVKDKINYEKDCKAAIYREKSLFSSDTFVLFILDEVDYISIGDKAKVWIDIDGEKIEGVAYYDDYIFSGDKVSVTYIKIKIDSDVQFTTLSKMAYLYRPTEIDFKDCHVKINDFSINDSDVETFTNLFISMVKDNKSDENSKIEEVKGGDIRFWYNKNNYQSKMGKLGNSCMSASDPDFFDIYAMNENISLLILKNNSDKLIGRALLWHLDDGKKFMDRIYTANDYDDNLFIDYAVKNGIIYRNTSSENIKYFNSYEEISHPKLEITLKYSKFRYYPYIDTLCYLTDDRKLINYKSDDIIGVFKDVGGEMLDYGDE